eukprot:gene3985-14063_t
MRSQGTGMKVNHSGEDYNIISLGYNQDPRGQQLQYQDQSSMYRNQLRGQNLYSRDHSVSHNVVTGQQRTPPVGTPQRPMPPPQLREMVPWGQ